MNIEVARFIANTALGPSQQYRNMAAVPLFNSRNHGPDYFTLSEALARNHLTVTESRSNGAGPRLNVTNWSNTPVLVLDGEGLRSQTHTRVFDRTLLLEEQCDRTIRIDPFEPVWGDGYACPLIASASIAPLHLRRQTPTGASAGVIRAHSVPIAANSLIAEAEELNSYLGAFEPLPGQKGLLVAINGEMVGLDIISREQAYQALHAQLVSSYATAAALKSPACCNGDLHDKAMSFFSAAAGCEERKYPSLGYGLDYRFEGPGVSGTALVIGKHVIHLSWFAASSGWPAICKPWRDVKAGALARSIHGRRDLAKEFSTVDASFRRRWHSNG